MHRKKYEELTFTDDFMFCKVMENNLGICRQILELILNIRIKEIVVADRQKEIDVAADSKGIHDEWKVEYMTWNMMKELVYDEGKEAGIQEGKKIEKRKAIQRLIQKGFAKEMILELGYTREEYEEAQQSLL